MLSSWLKPCATQPSLAAKLSSPVVCPSVSTLQPLLPWLASSVNLFLFRFGGLESLALAIREVTRLRQFGVFVHRSVHSQMDTLGMPAGAALYSRVVHW